MISIESPSRVAHNPRHLSPLSGRKQMNRRRKWEAATPGPERIQLGLQMIEESKVGVVLLVLQPTRGHFIEALL